MLSYLKHDSSMDEQENDDLHDQTLKEGSIIVTTSSEEDGEVKARTFNRPGRGARYKSLIPQKAKHSKKAKPATQSTSDIQRVDSANKNSDNRKPQPATTATGTQPETGTATTGHNQEP